MIRTSLFSLLIILLCLDLSVAQEAGIHDLTYQELSELGRFGTSYSNAARTFDYRYEGVKGSPLLYEKWQQGILTMKGGRQLTGSVLYNINAMESQIFVGPSPKNFIAVADTMYMKLEIGDQVFMPFNTEIVEGKKNDHHRVYEVLWQSGDQKLLKRESAYFLEADYKGAYTADRRFDEYKRRVGYFYGSGDEFEKVRLKPKSVMASFNISKAQFKKWKTGEDITEEMLIQILTNL